MALPASGSPAPGFLIPGPIETQAARDMMVDSQVRPNKVTDPRIIQAMRTIPREAFLPAAQRALAYADTDVRLGGGRAMTAPMAIARLLQLAHPVAGEAALVIAAGTGYGAALLRACGAAVVALEEDTDLLAIARPALQAWASGVSLMAGPIGSPTMAGPFDLILIEGGITTLPDAVMRLMAPGGRVVAVRGGANGGGQAVIGRRAAGAISLVPAFDLHLTPLAAFQPVAQFVF
jgi:protein-L-isoaspartate(D-aspartate) O-methyltransferase